MKLLWCVKQTDVGRHDIFSYWAITSSLDHSTLCYLQDLLSTSLASRPVLLKRRPLRETPPNCRVLLLTVTGSHSGFHCLQLSQLEANHRRPPPSGALSPTANRLWLWPSLSPTDLTATGICIYYFITSTCFRVDNVVFFRLFTHVSLWLTARSKVNMYHLVNNTDESATYSNSLSYVYEFELGHTAAKTIQNICHAKVRFGCMIPGDQAKSDRSKSPEFQSHS